MHLPLICPVSGVSFRQEAVASVSEGQPLHISHDAENAADPNACVVTTAAGEMLGYIPAKIAERLMTERGETSWTGTIVEVLRGGDTFGLRIRVEAPGTEHALLGDPAGDGPSFEDPAAEETEDVESEAAAEAVEPAEAEVLVFSKSGRRLGRFVAEREDKVVVRSDSDIELEYPTTLVSVGEAS